MQTEKKKINKLTLILISFVAVVAIAGTTLALLNQKTQAANNNFAGAAVNIGVLENGETLESLKKGDPQGYAKITAENPTVAKTVQIKNINSEAYPTTDTYVRVRLVPKLVYDEGTEYAGQILPVDMTGRELSVTYTYGSSNWVEQKQDNGETYYYYKTAIAPGENSDPLITAVTVTPTGGYVIPPNTHFELEVLTEGLSAVQNTAVENAWGVTYNDAETTPEFVHISDLPAVLVQP